MKSGRESYQEVASSLISKYQPLYDIFPWDDCFDDTKFGSKELDFLVYDALSYGTPNETKAIREFIAASNEEKSITTSSLNVSEEIWNEKIAKAKILLEHVEPFVEAVLAYYTRVTN